MKQITPIDACLNLIDYIKANRDQLPEEFGDYLLPGLLQLRSGREKDLNKALGLAVGSGEAWQQLCYVWRTRERNRFIRQAAVNLIPDYGKVRAAMLIEFAMRTAIPDVRIPKKFETVVILCKLRQICMNHDGDSPLAVGYKRVIQIMDGDGC